MKYHQVKIENAGFEYWLKRTTWAFSQDRGDRFDSPDEARAALAKARKFTKPALFRQAQIVEVES